MAEMESSYGMNYIICVDDDRSVLHQLSAQLEEAFGNFCAIEYAESGEEALAVMEEVHQEGNAILLVISDQVMPGMKGDQFLEQVNRRFPQTRKILLTGYAGLESAMYAINHAGLDRYLEKPWDREEFLSIVRSLLHSTIQTSAVEEKFYLKDAIKNVQLFRDLTADAIALISAKLTLVTFQKDTVVFTIDDPGDCMYIIKSGEVKVVAGVAEQGEILAYLGRGNYFGEMALITGEPRSASIVTSMDSELFRLTKQDFDFSLAKHPSIALSLSHVLSQRLRDVSIKKAGRQNKVICILNTIQKEYETNLVVDLSRNLRKETNGRVVVVDLGASTSRELSLLTLGRENTGAHWILENLDLIQSDELSKILPEDAQGIKFFIPSDEEAASLSPYLLQLLSLLKESYHFVIIHVRTSANLSDDVIKIMEQANTVAYLFEQTPHASEEKFALLQEIQREYPAVMKKVEIIVVRKASSMPFSDSLSHLVGQGRIHYLRCQDVPSEVLQTLFSRDFHPSTPSAVMAKDRQVECDVSRIARRLGNVSVGLVLGGGGARAYAHLGILKVLRDEGIPVDIVAGTSMGAFIGALYIMGKTPEEILDISRDKWRKLNSPFSWTLPRIAFIKGKRIHNLVHEIFGDILIEDLPQPFLCVASDLVSGQEVVLSQGSLYKAILASGALPGFFEPVPLDGMYLVDGGVVNNVPGDVLKKQGVNFVIAVDVTPEREVHLAPSMKTGVEILAEGGSVWQRGVKFIQHCKTRFGTILLPRIIMRVMAIEGLEITRNKSRYFDIHIKPNLENFDLFDFKRLPQIVEIGEQAGHQAIGKIRSRIEALKHED